MATAWLAFGWRWFNLGSEITTFENNKLCRTTAKNNETSVGNNEKQAYQRGYEALSPNKRAPIDVNCGRADRSSKFSDLTTSERKYSGDKINSGTEMIAMKPNLSDQASPALETADPPIDNDTCDAHDPFVFGPNGSGYKGKEKSQKEYTDSSGIYDYRGSYSQPRGGKGRQPPDEDRGSDEPGKSPGGGGGPGRGRGPYDEGPSTKGKTKNLKAEGSHWEWFWNCCYCGHGLMSSFIEKCPNSCCHHRCASCPMESHRVRNAA